MRDGFVLQFPVYVILYPNQEARQYSVLGGDIDDQRHLSLFTEEVFAERARDQECPLGMICRFDGLTSMASHLELYKSWRVHHVVIDPHTEAKLWRKFGIDELYSMLSD